MKTAAVDVVVVGDEVESILTAVSAARCGAQTRLIRRSVGRLGGLSTRGGLCYMDITPEYKSPCFVEFLEKAGVIRVALDPARADAVLQTLLDEAGVQITSGVEAMAEYQEKAWKIVMPGEYLQARVLIDATPDADVARSLGVPYTVGLGGVFGEAHNFLGVTPVFWMTGVEREVLIAFEQSLREQPGMADKLAKALPHHPAVDREELLIRPVYSPDDMDYIDILNPVIGVAFHDWLGNPPETYPDAPIVIDGFNTARLPDGSLGFNGMVWRLTQTPDTLDTLLAFSHAERACPEALTEAMAAFREFLVQEGGMAGAVLIPPEEIYVRQTVNILARDMMTAEKAIRGGVSAEEAVGTSSYWLDLRGITFSRHFPGELLPKPVFNVGLNVAFPATAYQNLAVVSRAGGYSPIGQGACRIVQHNALLGEAVGIAAALAVQKGCPLAQIPAATVREVLSDNTGRPVQIEGHPTWPESAIIASQALKADQAAVARLQSAIVV